MDLSPSLIPNVALGVPHNVQAAGWIPFTVCTILCFIFSTLYILWYRSVRTGESSAASTLLAIAALFFTLISAFLVPVDVFLVSYMKDSNGTYKPWAEDPSVRQQLQWSVLQAYYAFYGIILIFAFLLLPFVFFYYALGSEVGATGPDGEIETSGTKFCRATKFTLTTLATFGLLIILGIFLPFDGTPPSNITQVEKIEYLWHEFKSSNGDNLIVFLMNVLNVIGLILIIVYMSYGMTSLPLGMIRGTSTFHRERASVQEQIHEIEEQITQIKSRYQEMESGIPHFESQQIERLERQLRILQRSKHDLDQQAKTFVNRLITCIRPFQFIIGIFCALFGFLIFISLLLTSIDKALHSQGPKTGYILQNGTLPNPIDKVLVWTQVVFPLDYILYSSIILFLVFCSVSGVKNLGIRFMWLTVYKIKAHSTKPQALVMMCLNLIFITVALSVIMFAIIPDYTTFGSQHYVDKSGGVNATVVKRCTVSADLAVNPDCNMSRIAVLLLAFHSRAWIFGATFFWLTWAFLGMVVISSIICLFRFRRTQLRQEEDDLEELLDDANPFQTTDATS